MTLLMFAACVMSILSPPTAGKRFTRKLAELYLPVKMVDRNSHCLLSDSARYSDILLI
jgi:hypothetical protein